MNYKYILSIACLLIAGIITSAVANEADWMPDANLRNKVRAELGLDAGTELTQADMTKLTELSAIDHNISDLTGLELATNLTELNLRDNEITDIGALSGLTGLTYLHLGGNSISDLSVLSGLTSLTHIYLGRNSISDLSALSDLTSLTHFSLGSGDVSDLSALSGLAGLVRLFLDSNSISDVNPLARLTNLQQLYLRHNNISDVGPLAGLTNLETLRLKNNPISDTSVIYGLVTDNDVDIDIDIPEPPVVDTPPEPPVVNTPPIPPKQILDTTPPGVSISVPESIQNGAFDVTITFSESVSDFVQDDLSLEGSTATATVTAWSADTDNAIYTVTITPTTSGEVILNIAADVATDIANNSNTAAIEQSVSVDVDSPSVTLTLSAFGQGGNNNRIDIQITFTEPVEGFEQTDLSVTTEDLTQLDLTHLTQLDSTNPPPIVSITGWTPDPDKTTYTAYITTYTETEGQVIVSVPADIAMDVAGNPNIAGEPLTVDIDQPLLYVFGHSGGPTGSASTTGCQIISPISNLLGDPGHPGRLDVNKDGSIDEDDVALVEAALGQSGDGIANSRTDINCDDTVDEDDLALLNDTESPSVRITVPTDAQPGAFGIKISFSEIVFDFDVTDISFEGSTTTATPTLTAVIWGRSTITYNVDITPTTNGDVVISIPADAAEDALGNKNTASAAQTVTVDMGVPSVSLTSGSADENGVFDIVITFSEAVSGFVQGDLHLSGSANPSITAWETSDDTVFTATITPASNGRIDYYVPAAVATDADNNPNIASARYSRDVDRPTVTVSVPTDEQSGAFDITFSFSEIVFDFEQTDISLAGSTAEATITDWTVVSHFLIQYGTRYEATITPTTSGTVVISVPAGVAIDIAGNHNTASDTHSVTVSLPDVGGNAPSTVLSRITNLLETTPLESLDQEQLESQLDILRAESDGSVIYLQAIAVLESTLAAMRPEKTRLLANYPNPFNPETWIPYHLANPSNVQITIYDARGSVVRQLDLGHQREGYYTSRNRAAYWDGRNDFGERVASGVYFYHLRADNMSLLRKMLILK